MTKSEHIRWLASMGQTPAVIAAKHGYSRQTIAKALKVSPVRGRPRKLARCEHCGQPLPRVNALT